MHVFTSLYMSITWHYMLVTLSHPLHAYCLHVMCMYLKFCFMQCNMKKSSDGSHGNVHYMTSHPAIFHYMRCTNEHVIGFVMDVITSIT